MKIAFHFDADQWDGFYGLPIEELLFGALLRSKLDGVHLKIHTGDLLIYEYMSDQDQFATVARRLFGLHLPTWNGLLLGKFDEALGRRNIYVMLIDGLPFSLRDALHRDMRQHECYLGAMQIYEAEPVHWMLYTQKLVPSYRLVERELRMFYSMGNAEEVDEGVAEHWRDTLPFSQVVSEDLGAQYTILDPYQSFEVHKRTAELASLLGEHLEGMANDLLIRLNDLDPRLNDALHVSMRTFSHIQTSAEAGMIAVSCRRFLLGLANCLFPPTDAKRNGRELTEELYINRLAAYVEDQLNGTAKDLALAQLDDIGKRLHALNEVANKGVHLFKGLTRSEVHRLLIGLTVWTYDVLALSRPPVAARYEAYEDEMVAFMKKVIARDKE